MCELFNAEVKAVGTSVCVSACFEEEPSATADKNAWPWVMSLYVVCRINKNGVEQFTCLIANDLI